MSDTATSTVVVPVSSTDGDLPLIKYSSIRSTDLDSRMLVLNGLSSSIPVADVLEKPIPVTNLVIQNVQLTNDRTGQVDDAERIVLLTEDGHGYHATSKGLMNGLKNMIAALGDPWTWTEPVDVTIHEEGKKPNAYFVPTFKRHDPKVTPPTK